MVGVFCWVAVLSDLERPWYRRQTNVPGTTCLDQVRCPISDI